MAHVRKTGAGTWQARYRAPDGRERARNFRRKVDAESFLATIEADKLRGEWTDPRRARVTFAEWNVQVQQRRVNLAASTRENDGSVIRSLILPTFGAASLSAIEPGHIRTWVADLVAAGYSPSTIRRAYTLLQLALDMAVDDGRLARSPCRRIALPRIEQSEKRFLGIEEVEHLAETITPRYRVFVLAGAYTGLRPRRRTARPARLPSPLLVPGRAGVGRRIDAAPRPPAHPRSAPHRRQRRPLRHLPAAWARLDPHHLRHLRAPVRGQGPAGRRCTRSRPGPNSRGLSADSDPIRRALTRPLKRRNPLEFTGDFVVWS